MRKIYKKENNWKAWEKASLFINIGCLHRKIKKKIDK